MKYLLMIYQNPAAWQAMPESEKKDFMSEAVLSLVSSYLS